LLATPPQAACPHCRTLSGRLEALSLQFMRVNVFRCPQCHHVWKAAKTISEISKR
jgi:hypothetical protein